jgi:hypothetical protein
MAKFNLKEHITKNKSTFFGSLNEGQFSWMTQDTGQQIGSEDENRIPVYMFDDKGNFYYEPNYDGYGDFGGMDYYSLLDKMNGGRGDRGRGIDLAFGNEKVASRVLFPALVTNPDMFNYKTHDFTKEAESDPNQSWYTPEEDDFYDQNDEEEYGYGEDEDQDLELQENKPTTKMKKSELKSKIKEMILAEMNLDIDNMEDAPESEVDFLAELEGMLDEAEGLTPLQDYVYQYEIEISGEDQAQEFLDDIKQLNTPQDVYDYYAYGRDLKDSDLDNIFRQVKRKFASSNTADDLTPLQKQAYSYAKERFGFEDAKNSLDQIKTLTTREEFSDWVQKKIEAEKSLDEAKGDEEVTDDVTADDVTVDDTETIDTTTTTEVDPNVKAVQDALTQAQAAAQKLGDPKLTDQIGNTITFFTRNHVVEKGAVAENINEMAGKTLEITKPEDLKKVEGSQIFKYDVFDKEEFEKYKVYILADDKSQAEKIAKEKFPKQFPPYTLDTGYPQKSNAADNLWLGKEKDSFWYGVEKTGTTAENINEVMFPMLKKILK